MTDKNRDQITSGSTSAFSFKHSDASETSTNFTSTNNFYKPIDGSQKILNNLLNEIPNIKEQELKNQLILFASSFQNALLKSVNFSSVVEVLPPLTFFQEDDESILLEWIFSDFRIGFSFEFDKQKSINCVRFGILPRLIDFLLPYITTKVDIFSHLLRQENQSS